VTGSSRLRESDSKQAHRSDRCEGYQLPAGNADMIALSAAGPAPMHLELKAHTKRLSHGKLPSAHEGEFSPLRVLADDEA
jgi:hypothetical protein